MDYMKVSGVFSNMGEDPIPMIDQEPLPKSNEANKPEDVEILVAAYRSDIDKLKILINENPTRACKIYEPTNNTLLHRIAEGGHSNCAQAAEYILDNWRDFDINAVNTKGNTALHNAVLDHDRLDLVTLFVKRGANVRITNKNGETALHLIARLDTPRALEIAGILLSHSRDFQGPGYNVFHIAAKHYAANMLKYLWEQSEKDESLISQNSKEYGTPLHCTVQKGGDDPRAVKTLKFLLGIVPKEKVNELSEGSSALHLVAKDCSLSLFTAMVHNINVNVFKPNSKGKSCLDVLAEASDKNANAITCAQTLFKKSKKYLSVSTAEKNRLVFNAIKIAVRKKSTNMVQLLVQEHGNFENSLCTSENGELLENIYKKTPIAAIPMLNKTVTYKPSKDADDLENIDVDMGPITGFKLYSDDPLHESETLFGIFQCENKQQRKILEHAVVNIFLIEKWKRLEAFTVVYIFLYLLWLAFYSTLNYELYPPECPTESNSTGAGDENPSLHNSAVPKIILSLGFQESLRSPCDFNKATARFLAICLYVFTIFFIGQECIKFSLAKTLKHYLTIITVLQIIRHLGVAVNITSAFMDSNDIPNFQYHLGVILFCLSWLLLLNELAYIPSLALWLSILLKTAWNYGKFMLYFVPILIAFVPMLGRYVRKGKQFTFLLFGIIKNLILMTGEVDYKETFYEDEGPNLGTYDIVGQFILVVAVFGFGLVLANVLTGAAVKNFQDLYKDAEYETAVMQLKSIHFVDSLMAWLQQWPPTSQFSQYFERFQLKYETGESRTVTGINTQKYSDILKQRIRKIATPEL